MKNNLIIIILVILIFVSGIGGYFLGQNSMKEYKAIVDQLYPNTEEVFEISGEITEINGNSITIETSSLQTYLPNEEIKTELIIINIDDKTVIYSSDFYPETDETKKMISFSRLSAGDIIKVLSSENIKGKDQIIATEIVLYPAL